MTLGDRRAVRIVDASGNVINERAYRAGVEDSKPLVKELELLRDRWQLTLFPNETLSIVDVELKR